MATKTYLYNNGNTCDGITGGWYASDTWNHNAAASQSGKVTFNESTMVASVQYGPNQAGGKIITRNMIDVTNYDTIYFDCEYSESDGRGYLGAIYGLFENLVATSDKNVASVQIINNTDRAVYAIDVSGISGSYYIGVWLGWSNWGGSCNTTIHNVYLEARDLIINADDGSDVSVYRSYSKVGSTGYVNAGSSVLSHGDIIKIAFSPRDDYKLISHKVNGADFVSGNTHTVSGDVCIDVVSQPLSSDIGATDANIGSTTSITVKRYDKSYTHTVSYSFRGLQGVIAENSTEESIAWSVPSSFYEKILTEKFGACILTCTTYSGSMLIGSTSCTFKVTADYDSCCPVVSGTVTDVNPSTTSLTGNAATLVRFQSIAKCVISATARNSAEIVSRSINGIVCDDSNTVSYSGSTPVSYVFTATDSRGYSSSMTITPAVIPYIKLTINPVFERPSTTTGEVVVTFNGNYFNGEFGANNNTLSIRFRYRESDSNIFSQWNTIPRDKYILASQTYYTTSPVSLGYVYNYQKPYVFEIQAYDGAGSIVLSETSAVVQVQKGETVFDWGENDFSFHVPVSMDGNLIKDLPDAEDPGDAVSLGYMSRYISGFNYQTHHIPHNIVLAADKWSQDGIQIINVPNVTEDSTVISSAGLNSQEAYDDNVIRCISHSDGTLTYSCVFKPEVNIDINVIIFN